MEELIDIKKVKATAQKIWTKSMGTILALIIGLGFGLLMKEGTIIEDCKYSGSFRIGTQAFSCQRKI